MIKWIKKLFGHRSDLFNKNGLIVKVAFKCGGIEYMEVDNIYSLPYERGMKAIMVYEELRMKCDYDYLKAHASAVNNIFTESKKIGLQEFQNLKKLNDQLLERLNHIVDTDIIYKLASVIFFDKNESPFEYNFDYAKKKIAHWKQHSSAHDFFLQEPLTRLIPFLKQPGVNFQTYSDVISRFNKVHWDEIYSVLSEKQKNAFSVSKDFYVGAMPPSLQTSKN